MQVKMSSDDLLDLLIVVVLITETLEQVENMKPHRF